MDDGDGAFDPLAGDTVDLDLALDLDLSRAPAPRPSRPARFQPKIKGKAKAEPAAGPEPVRLPPPRPVLPVKKQEAEVEPSSSEGPSTISVACAPDVEEASEAMEVDGEDEKQDSVVREIDVFCNPAPLDEDTYLYMMQYVLRPSWRPYELSERCEKVRVKPKESKIEIDLSLDADCENYDRDVADSQRLEKQTLYSSAAPLVTSYAVGILDGNQLHINPVHAVVQLRPSMAHLNAGAQKKKQNAQGVESSTASNSNAIDSSGSSTRQGQQDPVNRNEKAEDDEPWISLEYHPTDGHFTERYHRKMIAKERHQIPFMMKPSDYVSSLCPGTSTDNNRIKVPSRRLFLSLPLEERLKKWFSEVSQVNHFNALMHLAPDSSEEDVLNVLPLYADLVQGLWVSKSSLLPEVKLTLFRDYILCLFSMKPTIPFDKLKMMKVDVKSMLTPLAVERRTFCDWKFREAADFAFMKKYPDVVKKQECAWSARREELTNSFQGFGKNMSALKSSANSSSARTVKKGKVDTDAHGGRERPLNSAASSMSSETREHLPRALLKIFQEKKVRSLSSIIKGLRDLAISNSSRPRDDPKIKALVNAATNGASAPASELESIVVQVAVNVHGVYVMKPSGESSLDLLRNVVIDLFRAKEPQAKLNKQEIRIAAMTRLKKDITDPEYRQVVQELCQSNKGSWALKTGD